MKHIDEAFGDQPNIEDSFETNGKLTEGEKTAWDNEDPNVASLVTKALEWAYDCGYQACHNESEEAKCYEQQAKEYEENKKSS